MTTMVQLARRSVPRARAHHGFGLQQENNAGNRPGIRREASRANRRPRRLPKPPRRSPSTSSSCGSDGRIEADLRPGKKTGFVQAKFAKDGNRRDALDQRRRAEEEALKKIRERAAEKLGDDPIDDRSKNQTTALIANRWRIKVSSPSARVMPRASHCSEKFDLPGLRAFNPSDQVAFHRRDPP